MASGHLKTPHQQAEHMAAPTSPCDIVQKTLANSEPSTHAISFRKPLPTRSRPHMAAGLGKGVDGQESRSRRAGLAGARRNKISPEVAQARPLDLDAAIPHEDYLSTVPSATLTEAGGHGLSRTMREPARAPWCQATVRSKTGKQPVLPPAASRPSAAVNLRVRPSRPLVRFQSEWADTVRRRPGSARP